MQVVDQYQFIIECVFAPIVNDRKYQTGFFKHSKEVHDLIQQFAFYVAVGNQDDLEEVILLFIDKVDDLVRALNE